MLSVRWLFLNKVWCVLCIVSVKHHFQQICWFTDETIRHWVCLRSVLGVGGGGMLGLAGKVAGKRTMIAAFKRGLHRFTVSSCTCHYGIRGASSAFAVQHLKAGQSLDNTFTLLQAQSFNRRGSEGGLGVSRCIGEVKLLIRVWGFITRLNS